LTIEHILEMADQQRPNAFTPQQKTEWLNALEGRIQTQVWLRNVREIQQYVWPEDAGSEPLTAPPYDDIYLLWLLAMIDQANGEYDRYRNSMAIFNAFYGSYVRWFASVYEPAQGYGRYEWCADES